MHGVSHRECPLPRVDPDGKCPLPRVEHVQRPRTRLVHKIHSQCAADAAGDASGCVKTAEEAGRVMWETPSAQGWPSMPSALSSNPQPSAHPSCAVCAVQRLLGRAQALWEAQKLISEVQECADDRRAIGVAVPVPTSDARYLRLRGALHYSTSCVYSGICGPGVTKRNRR